MPKLAALKALKLVSVKKTTLYNVMGCRHGSVHYNRRSRSRNHERGTLATLLWYAINALQKRK